MFRQIIDSVTPYRSAAEWMFHQGFDSASVVDIAANWHEHHKAALGSNDVAESTVRENALAFNLADAAGLGKLVLGRRNNPTRLVVDKGALKAYIEAGPTAPPWAATGEETDEPTDVQEAEDVLAPEDAGSETEEAEPEPLAPPHAQEHRAFISHGKNTAIVEQVETMLELADIESEIAEAEETTAIPVPEKVLNAMRRCTAGIIVCSVEESHKDAAGNYMLNYMLNDNVLIEIGAAFVLYDKRVVLVWDKRLPVPSNLQGLYRCEYEGDDLSWSAGMKLMKAIRGFKK